MSEPCTYYPSEFLRDVSLLSEGPTPLLPAGGDLIILDRLTEYTGSPVSELPPRMFLEVRTSLGGTLPTWNQATAYNWVIDPVQEKGF